MGGVGGGDEDVVERIGQRGGRGGESSEASKREGELGVDEEGGGREAAAGRGEKGGKEELEAKLGLSGGTLASDLGDGAYREAAVKTEVEEGATEGELLGRKMEKRV